MLTRIWQWLKGLFQRLFGGGSSLSDRGRQDAYATSGDAPTPRPLEDSDYEYLFRQLLEGVAHGWQQDRILRWFEGLKGRTTDAEWVAWLRRFGERVLASPAPNEELARRMVLLGEQMPSTPSLREIGDVAYDIGRQLLLRETSGAVWEYEGPDGDATAPTLAPFPPYQAEETLPEAAEQVETITFDELLERLQEDENLRQVIAQQMGVETSEPEVLIQTLVNQFNQLTAANQEAIDEAESWFNQGFQQDQAGDLDGAIASYDRAVEIKPDLYEAWFNQGNVFSKLERFEEAIASYDKAIEIKPNFQEAWHNRGNALSNLGRLDEASASFEKAKESPAD